ncbi:hypothetical protein WDZ92_50670, partial [Nostoc sp. NIES-2111]
DNIKNNNSGDEFVGHARAEVTSMSEIEVATAVEVAHEWGKRVACHSRAAESVKRAVRNGVDCIYHCDFADEEALDMLEAVKDRIFVGPAFGLVHNAVFEHDRVGMPREVVERIRNFYGVVKVVKEAEDDPDEASLVMRQAGIDQGSQFLAPARRSEPACAFTAGSGVGHAIFRNAKRRADPNAPIRIGIVGLGAGMIAAHGREGDLIRYYELNPAVKALVDRHFSFVRDTK